MISDHGPRTGIPGDPSEYQGRGTPPGLADLVGFVATVVPRGYLTSLLCQVLNRATVSASPGCHAGLSVGSSPGAAAAILRLDQSVGLLTVPDCPSQRLRSNFSLTVPLTPRQASYPYHYSTRSAPPRLSTRTARLESSALPAAAASTRGHGRAAPLISGSGGVRAAWVR
jgi:hypothetical protein